MHGKYLGISIFFLGLLIALIVWALTTAEFDDACPPGQEMQSEFSHIQVIPISNGSGGMTMMQSPVYDYYCE